MSEAITINKAKMFVRRELEKAGLNNRITARTVDFTDLARCKRIFVRVHDWKPDPAYETLHKAARLLGFYVEFG
jgi:hypothetical protein